MLLQSVVFWIKLFAVILNKASVAIWHGQCISSAMLQPSCLINKNFSASEESVFLWYWENCPFSFWINSHTIKTLWWKLIFVSPRFMTRIVMLLPAFSFHLAKWLEQNLMLSSLGEKQHFVRWILIIKNKQTAEPINQLRSVKISLCVEANIWTQERGDNQCSVSLPVLFLIPQDKSVSAPTPSLLSHASICLSLSPGLEFWSHSHSSPSVCLSFPLPPHTLWSSPPFLPVCLRLHPPSCCSSATPLSLPQDCRVYSLSLRLVLLQRRMETCLAAVVTAGLLWE